MNIVLLGGPGAGKGTLAANLLKHYKMQHFSTGDLLRAAVASGTEQGLAAKKFMDAGDLVPDEVIVGIMKERLSALDADSQGVILDGFPRTTAQAEALDSMLAELGQKVDLALLLDCPDQVVVDRICNRRTCGDCGFIGNLNWIPKEEWDSYVCPECGGEMTQRADDTEETVRNRLDVYKKQTAPLIDYYKNAEVLKDIDAAKDAETSLNLAREILGDFL